MTADRLLAVLLAGRPETPGTRLHGSKLGLATWARGAALFADAGRHVPLRDL